MRRQTYFISIFEFPILCTPLLDSVVRQVNQSILNIFYVVLAATCPQIPLRVEIPLKVAIDSCCQSEAADVKLPVFVE